MSEEMNLSNKDEHASETMQDDRKIRVRSKSRFVAGSILIFLGVWSFLFQKGWVWGPLDVVDYLTDRVDIILPLVIILVGSWLLYRSFTKSEQSNKSPQAAGPSGHRRLYRSSIDKKILGVAGGIAEYFDWDPTLVRMMFIVMIFATSGFFIIAYLFAAIATPYDYALSRYSEKQSDFKPKIETQ